jgi:hypothetical protein
MAGIVVTATGTGLLVGLFTVTVDELPEEADRRVMEAAAGADPNTVPRVAFTQ